MGGLDGGRTCGVAEDSGLPTAGGPQGGPRGGPLGGPLGLVLRGKSRQTLSALHAATCTLIQAALVVAPYACWQMIGYWRVCGAADPSTPGASTPGAWLLLPMLPLLESLGLPPPAASVAPPLRRHAASTAGTMWTPTRVARDTAAGALLPSGWCEGRSAFGLSPPDLYATVQAEYWGVGLFRYYELKQLPNFALALPMLLLWACAVAEAVRLMRQHYSRGIPRIRVDAYAYASSSVEAETARLGRREPLAEPLAAPAHATPVTRAAELGLRPRRPPPSQQQQQQQQQQQKAEGTDGSRGPATAPAASDQEWPRRGKEEEASLSLRALVYLGPWSVLSLLSLLCANVQVTTRLVGAACPPVYWTMAYVLLRRGDPSRSWLGGESRRAWMLRYLSAFALIGTALHANDFPWT